MPSEKTCSKCGQTKGLEKFYRQKEGKHGRQAACIECHAQAQKERLKDPAARARHQLLVRERHFRLRYDMSVEEYDRMLEAQGGGCAICGATRNGRHLCVDHDHSTGEVRGILCNTCNVTIGRIEKGPGLQPFAEYLDAHT
jgi:hypothetical protein